MTPRLRLRVSATLAAMLSASGCVAAMPPPVWRVAAPLAEARYQHGVTRLMTGEILVQGGRGPDDTFPLTAELYNPWSGQWHPAGRLNQGRYYHTSTMLRDGRVLVAGGINLIDGHLATAEIFDPATNLWTRTGDMQWARREHTASLLTDGTVLVAGGQAGVPLDTAEIFDPASGTWRAAGRLAEARQSAAATVLSNGDVLVTGGAGEKGRFLASAEVFDRRRGEWRPARTMAHPRDYHTLTPLTDHRVIVIGGRDDAGPVAAAEIYDERAGTWRLAARMLTPRLDHRVTTMADDRLLVTAGMGSGFLVESRAEIYDPRRNKFVHAPGLDTARYGASGALLVVGAVLVAGGARSYQQPGQMLASAETLDRSSGTWQKADPAPALGPGRPRPVLLNDGSVLLVGPSESTRWAPAASTPSNPRSAASVRTATPNGGPVVRLGGGALLAIGGADGGASALVESYDPPTNRWSAAAPLAHPRQRHSATVLMNGHVLVAGGRGPDGAADASAEVYDPRQGSWSPVGALSAGRSDHRALLLPDGRVLVAGGGGTGLLVGAEIYDPATAVWRSAGGLAVPRASHTMNLLPNGRVLVAGGVDERGTALASVELFDPADGQWLAGPPMMTARARHTATMLTTGRLLVAGGDGDDRRGLRSVEVFDLTGGGWRSAPPMRSARIAHAAMLMADASVLVAGGDRARSSERYVPNGIAQPGGPAITSVSAGAATLRVQGSRFTDLRPHGGGGFQALSSSAPVVAVMGLSNEAFGRIVTSPGTAWSETEIVTGLAGGLPPGLALVMVSDSRGALTAAVIALPAQDPDAR